MTEGLDFKYASKVMAERLDSKYVSKDDIESYEEIMYNSKIPRVSIMTKVLTDLLETRIQLKIQNKGWEKADAIIAKLIKENIELQQKAQDNNPPIINHHVFMPKAHRKGYDRTCTVWVSEKSAICDLSEDNLIHVHEHNNNNNNQQEKQEDLVNHPPHYKSFGAVCIQCSREIECIDIVEHMNFSLGNAVKYLWRAGKKGSLIEDLQKAVWYITREIERLNKSE